MTKTDFYKQYVRPYLKKNDRPHNRQLFHDTKDMLHKDGNITDRQVQNWCYPSNNSFESKRDRGGRC